MSILQAIGLGVAIIIFKVLIPEVFKAFEDLLLEFFGFISTALSGDFSSQFALPPGIVPGVE